MSSEGRHVFRDVLDRERCESAHERREKGSPRAGGCLKGVRVGRRRRLGRQAAAVGGSVSSEGRHVFEELSHEVLGACVDV